MKKVNMQLANSLKFLRSYCGNLTQEELSEKTGISRGLIAMIETGSNPSINTLVALSMAFEIRVSSIIRIAELLDEGHLPESPTIQNILRKDDTKNSNFLV